MPGAHGSLIEQAHQSLLLARQFDLVERVAVPASRSMWPRTTCALLGAEV
jgi:hypothetical protein